MKKMLSLAVALVATVMLGSSAWAALDFTAEVTFTGGDATFDAALSSGSKLQWNTDGIIGADEPQWKTATNHIVMTKNITKVATVYFYQTNTAAAGTGGDSNYVATSSRTEVSSDDPTGEVLLKKYNGLVYGKTHGGEKAKDYIPLSFYVSTVTVANPNMDPTSEGNYSTRWLADSADTVYDKTSGTAVAWARDGYSTVANEEGYVTLVDEDNNALPIDGSASVETGYLYIGAKFPTGIIGSDKFGSNHIKFELVTE